MALAAMQAVFLWNQTQLRMGTFCLTLPDNSHYSYSYYNKGAMKKACVFVDNGKMYKVPSSCIHEYYHCIKKW